MISPVSVRTVAGMIGGVDLRAMTGVHNDFTDLSIPDLISFITEHG